MITVKQSQKAGLGSCCALASKKLQAAYDKIQLFNIQKQILNPEACTLAHRYRLGRLEMSKTKSGLSLILKCKAGQLCYNGKHLAFYKLQRFGVDKNIGVITHIAGGGSQVNNTPGLFTLGTKGMDMSHNIMAGFFFLGFRHIVINGILESDHFINLLLGYVKPQFLF